MRRFARLGSGIGLVAALALGMVMAQEAPAPGTNVDALQGPLDRLLDVYVRDGFVYYRALKADRAKLDRYVATLDVAQATYDNALAQIRRTEGSLNQAKDQLDKTVIYVPMDGTISSLASEIGERVVATGQFTGTEIMRIADLNVMEVQVDVGENDIPRVKYGDTAVIEVDAYSNRKFKGIVTQIASSSKGAATATASGTTSSAEQVTSYIVHIRILNDCYKDLIDPSQPKNFPFRPGMSANADIQTRTHTNVLSVPINAVTTREKNSNNSVQGDKKDDQSSGDNKTAVTSAGDIDVVAFVLQPGDTVRKVKVRTDIQDINYIEIADGLKEGDMVITGAYSTVSKTLKSGTKVKVVPKDKLFEGNKN